MAVCLKIICFAIWMTIMMVLIHGSNQRKSPVSQRICLQLTEDDEAERWFKACTEQTLRDMLISAVVGRYKQMTIWAVNYENILWYILPYLKVNDVVYLV